MRLTNKHDLPEPVVRALSFDNYSKGNADFSVTELLDSPRIRALQWRYRDEVTQDVTDNFFSLLGRACHQILEWGASGSNRHTSEERLFLTVNVDGFDIIVSGSMDLQETSAPEGSGEDVVDILDYKVTSVRSAMSDKASWEQQLNLYAHLARETKQANVVALRIVVFLRDWQKSVAKRDKFYPQAPIIVLPAKLWPAEEAARFLLERIRLHMDARDAALCGDAPAPCTSEERWEGEASFAVMKLGGKRALRVFTEESEAKRSIAESDKPLILERRGGEPRRCIGNWCRVAEFCDFGREIQNQQREEQDDF